jgi:hypothetical protein
MTTRKKTNYLITAVLSTFILFLLSAHVGYGAKDPSAKPAGKPKSGQLTKKKINQYIQRVEKNNPKRAAQLRKLRKDNPKEFRETVRKALKAGPKKSVDHTKKAAKAVGGRFKQHRFSQMCWRRGGSGRGGRFTQMGRGQGGRGRGGQFAQMGRGRGGRVRGGQFAPMHWPRGGRGKGRQFGRAEHLWPAESDIWGDEGDWY